MFYLFQIILKYYYTAIYMINKWLLAKFSKNQKFKISKSCYALYSNLCKLRSCLFQVLNLESCLFQTTIFIIMLWNKNHIYTKIIKLNSGLFQILKFIIMLIQSYELQIMLIQSYEILNHVYFKFWNL